MNAGYPSSDEIPLRQVFRTWWPLAASWLLMAGELPALSAVVARLANPEINLAAYGGIVYPLALIVEAPIIMLLSASTALCKDWATYQKLHRFMMTCGALLTGLHLLIVLTPLYDLIVRAWIGVPASVVEPGRLGLLLIVPWSWSIAYRRFQQGVLIRFGYSRSVGVGTVIRLLGGGTVLAIGYLLALPGVAVGALSQAVGVFSEAVYAGLRVQPVLRNDLKAAPPVPALTWKDFARFYIPLALTSLLGLLWQPLGSAALSRMADPLVSLAVWPVAAGLVGMFRSSGFALNEVVVAMLELPGSYRSLRRFVLGLAAAMTGLQVLVWATPLAMLWFEGVSALPSSLAEMAWIAFGLAIPMATLSVFQSWFQGSLLHRRRTGAIPQATLIFLGVFLGMAALGIAAARFTGLYVGMVGFVLASLAQVAWLGWSAKDRASGGRS